MATSFPKERAETLAMIWPVHGAPPAEIPVSGCAFRFGLSRADFEQVQAAAGWVVSPEQWRQLMTEIVPGSMVLAYKDGEPVAAACAIKHDGGWVELAWVAVSVQHRGQGLGKSVCAALTRHLLSHEITTLFGSTQDTRLAALRIYIDLGFHPVYRPEKAERWQQVCAELDRAYLPVVWGWPDDRSD